MIHKMKLSESTFERIKNGTKTIEFRLDNEKRQQNLIYKTHSR